MDAAYDVPRIIAYSRLLEHIPLVDKNPRRDKVLADLEHSNRFAKASIDIVFFEKKKLTYVDV